MTTLPPLGLGSLEHNLGEKSDQAGKNDHVDNNRLPKKIKPLPLHSRVVYLEKISHFTQVLSDSLVGCPASGVN